MTTKSSTTIEDDELEAERRTTTVSRSACSRRSATIRFLRARDRHRLDRRWHDRARRLGRRRRRSRARGDDRARRAGRRHGRQPHRDRRRGASVRRSRAPRARGRSVADGSALGRTDGRHGPSPPGYVGGAGSSRRPEGRARGSLAGRRTTRCATRPTTSKGIAERRSRAAKKAVRGDRTGGSPVAPTGVPKADHVAKPRRRGRRGADGANAIACDRQRSRDSPRGPRSSRPVLVSFRSVAPPSNGRGRVHYLSRLCPTFPTDTTSRRPSRRSTQRWLDAGCFTPTPTRPRASGGDREPFTIVMPPPNVTAILHVGHGLNNTVQDVHRALGAHERHGSALGARHRSRGHRDAERRREAARRTKARRASTSAATRSSSARRRSSTETGGAILEQLRAIGASADWTRTAYTLSPELSRAVREAFVRLYERGLIYRGHRVIHWCPRCLTSLSDEEAEFQRRDGHALPHRVSGRRTDRVARSRSRRRAPRRCSATSPSP